MRFSPVCAFAAFLLLLCPEIAAAKVPEGGAAQPDKGVPIYLYHRFAHEITDSMTVSVGRFESQLKKFKEDNSPVIPLRQLVDSLLKKTGPVPPHSVVLTVDDGHI